MTPMTSEVSKRHFGAPWSPTLWILTIGAGGGAGIGIVVSGLLWMQLLLGSILIVPLALSVRGYSVQEGTVLVHRLGWATRIDLTRLQTVEAAPGAMRGSTMTVGNGGLFGFVGHFRNDVLGAYRAYATKRENAVVLHLEDGPVVVTPGDPAAFVEAVENERGPGS